MNVVVESFTKEDVRRVKGDQCYICTKDIDFNLPWPDPKSASLDHIKPLSRGGAHTVANTAMVHLLCNQRKGAREVVDSVVAVLK